MEPGVYFNLSNAEYHSGPGISKSQLDMVALSPALLKWQESAPVDEEKLQALDMGTALHCLLLEPDEFDKRFIVAPAFNRRTTAGKAAEAEFLAECRGMGMTVMDAEQGRKLKLMRDSAPPILPRAGCSKPRAIARHQSTGTTMRPANCAASARTSF